MSHLLITLVHSLNGVKKKQQETATALGLRKIGDQVIQENNAAILGMCTKISHLVAVDEVEIEEEAAE